MQIDEYKKHYLKLGTAKRSEAIDLLDEGIKLNKKWTDEQRKNLKELRKWCFDNKWKIHEKD